MASMLMLMLAIQVVMGVYLKLHLEKGLHVRIRKYTVMMHGMMGKAMPVMSWVQMLFGGITALGFCRGDHLGQCLAHFIMGSAFIGYGIILTILLLVGQAWLRRSGRSQEFFDSLLIAAWGCVNTFTEHRWGGPWVKNDLQHTSMGIVWWCAGLLGVWLSRRRDGRPKRNLFPALVIMLTGWGMSAHPQSLELSTHVHTVFGYTLMAAGAVRVVEISFVLKDQNSLSKVDNEETNSFQFLTPFVSESSHPINSLVTHFPYSFFTHPVSSSWAPLKNKWPSWQPLTYLTSPTSSSFTAYHSYSFSSSPCCYIFTLPMSGRLTSQSPRLTEGPQMDMSQANHWIGE